MHKLWLWNDRAGVTMLKNFIRKGKGNSNLSAGVAMLKNFVRNEDGQYAIMFYFLSLPVLASVGLAVDYSNVTRLKSEMTNSIDAACIATGKEFITGLKTDEELRTFNRDFFYGNFTSTTYGATTVTTTLPTDAGNTTKELKCKGQLEYKTLFGGVLGALTNSPSMNNAVIVKESTMRMRNVAEIALVLDNSGSMNYNSANQNTSDPNTQRMALLRTASKNLITQLIDLGAKIQQTSDPVKFSLVPFSASVNVGPANASASWMDTRGVSPIHHENLNWGTMGALDTPWKTVGADGAKLDASGLPLSRFSILKQLKFDMAKGAENTLDCRVWKYGAITTTTSGVTNCAIFNRTVAADLKGATDSTLATAMGVTQAALKTKYEWEGCVEERPSGLSMTDTVPSSGTPASLFVPMFTPDSFNLSKYNAVGTNVYNDSGYNNWWPDYEPALTLLVNQPGTVYKTANNSTMYNQGASSATTYNYTDATWRASTGRAREADARKYYNNKPLLYGTSNSSATSTSSNRGQWLFYSSADGPNVGCTTPPITPLTGSKTTLNTAIDAMIPTAGTNVPEGIAWGWRSISSTAPFTEGTVESNRSVDKVIIVLTDGVNTYGSVSGTDYAGNKSYYASSGYSGYAGNTGPNGSGALTDATNVARILQSTSSAVEKSGTPAYLTTNYTDAMNEHMVGTLNLDIPDPVNTDIDSTGGVCTNVKGENIILMTVGLDLNPNLSSLSTAQKKETRIAIAALKACAGRSKSRKDSNGNYSKLYWNACSSTAYTGCTSLDQTFKEIADELSNLRFTQ